MKERIKVVVEGIYCEESDITFIMENTYIEGYLKKSEVKGFYFGTPDEEKNKTFYNDLVVEF